MKQHIMKKKKRTRGRKRRNDQASVRFGWEMSSVSIVEYLIPARQLRHLIAK